MEERPKKDQAKQEREVRLGGQQQNYPGPRPPEWRSEIGAGGPERESAPEQELSRELEAEDETSSKHGDARVEPEQERSRGSEGR